MTARFWLPIVFGLGKIALVLIIILVILVAVSNAEEKTQMKGNYFSARANVEINGDTYEVVDHWSVIEVPQSYLVDVTTRF